MVGYQSSTTATEGTAVLNTFTTIGYLPIGPEGSVWYISGTFSFTQLAGAGDLSRLNNGIDIGTSYTASGYISSVPRVNLDLYSFLISNNYRNFVSGIYVVGNNVSNICYGYYLKWNSTATNTNPWKVLSHTNLTITRIA